MSYLGLFLGAFLAVAVFSVLIACTYFLARTRTLEAEERQSKAIAFANKSRGTRED